ncbi:MAG: hypothetical protein PHE24_00280 [Patescibacteria group bacterium]|nr:hypothetical protein [Patescibacteria group bacterium]
MHDHENYFKTDKKEKSCGKARKYLILGVIILALAALCYFGCQAAVAYFSSWPW